MLIIIPLIVVAICLLLAWFSKSRRIWKICLINVLIIAVYNLVGWLYILNFLGEGGAGLGPGLLLIYGTILHIALLFVAIIVMTMHRAVKDQQGK